MNHIKKALFALGCAVLPSPASAAVQSYFIPPPTFSASASTLGAGAGIGFHDPDGLFGMRASLNVFHFGINFDQGGSRAQAQARFQNETLLVDLYPWRQHFHVTTGVIFNQNSANVSASPQVTGALLGFITHTHYTGVVGNVHGPISFNPIAPYFGVGWDFNPGQKWAVKLDIGAMYQGNGRIALTPTGLLATNKQMRAQAVASAQHADSMINKMSFYPIISFQVGFRF
jgi:hypothetical protein